MGVCIARGGVVQCGCVYVVLLFLGEVFCGARAPCLEVFMSEGFSAVCDATWAGCVMSFLEEEDSGAFVWEICLVCVIWVASIWVWAVKARMR